MNERKDGRIEVGLEGDRAVYGPALRNEVRQVVRDMINEWSLNEHGCGICGYCGGVIRTFAGHRPIQDPKLEEWGPFPPRCTKCWATPKPMEMQDRRKAQR